MTSSNAFLPIFSAMRNIGSLLKLVSFQQKSWSTRVSLVWSIYDLLRQYILSYYHDINTDIPDLLSPSLPIVYCFWQVFRATSCIGREQLYVGSSWSSYLCSAMWRGPQEYITYDLIPTSPAVSCMLGSFNFDSFRDGWLVAVQLLLCEVLPSALVQYCSQNSCVVSIKILFISLLGVHEVHPYSSIDTTTAWIKTASYLIGHVWLRNNR